VPEKYRAFAARGPRYKLVQAAGAQPAAKWKPRYELFDIQEDPFETKDLAADKPDVVADLKRQYDDWFADVTKKGFDPPRIVVGSDKEDPVRLSRQDWRGPKAGWEADSVGHWDVTVERTGRYEVRLRSRTDFDAWGIDATRWEQELGETAGTIGKLAALPGQKPATRNQTVTLELKKGPARLTAWVKSGGKQRGVDYLELKYIGPGK
jgi:hypothetical protein